MALDLPRRRRRSRFILAAAAAAGISVYGTYMLYQNPSMAKKRKKLFRLFKTLISISEAFSSLAETINLVSSDLNRFLKSESNEVPNSLRQLSKIARSDEFSASISRVSEALTVGIVHGFGSESVSGSNSGFSEKVLNRLFSADGSEFASVVVGSFANNLIVAFYSGNPGRENENLSPWWISLISDNRSRDFVAECIRCFVSTAVAVYLEKTMGVNTYDEFFAGLTNPKHDLQVKDLLVSVCNGAVENLVKTSHQVFTASNQEEGLPQQKDDKIKEIGQWVNQVSSTLAVPSNRSLVLDMTGRVTFETVKSFLEFVLWKIPDRGVVRGASVVHDEVVKGLEVVKYVGAQSLLVATICFALCLHVMPGTRVLNLA